MAAELPGGTAGKAEKPAPVHSDQSLILRIQTDYLKYERELEHADLQDRLQEERIRRFGRRVRLAILIPVAVLLAAIGAAAVILIREAVTADGVVVEPFHATPDLAAHGVDGTVIARGLMDELMRLHRVTRLLALRRGLTTVWSNGIKLDLPQPGLSVGALTRVLRARYGSELHVTGDLVESAGDGALALTVRGDDMPPKTFSAPADSLAALLRSAAEYVYGQSAPGLWALYLSGEGRYLETIDFVQAALPAASETDKPHLLMASGIALEPTGGSPQGARAQYQAALKLKPDYWDAWISVQNTSINLGDEQGAWSAGEEMRRVAGGRPGRAPLSAFQSWDLLTWNLPALLVSLAADAKANNAVSLALSAAGISIADVHARLHDLAAAEQALPVARDDHGDPASAALTHLMRARLATESGDNLRAAAEIAAYDAATTNAAVAADVGSVNCWIAPAEEAAGHPDRADAVLVSSGNFVDCYRFRADIIDGRGDWPAARKAYAKAVALARDLPAAYYSLGLALERHGDLAAAEEKLQAANQRGPHWADPLKAWGDLLMKQGRGKEALAKYDEALKYAPNWAALRQARDEAAARQTS